MKKSNLAYSIIIASLVAMNAYKLADNVLDDLKTVSQTLAQRVTTSDATELYRGRLFGVCATYLCMKAVITRLPSPSTPGLVVTSLVAPWKRGILEMSSNSGTVSLFQLQNLAFLEEPKFPSGPLSTPYGGMMQAYAAKTANLPDP